MVITWENIDDVLKENGLIKDAFNKRLKIGRKWLDVYDRNLEKIFLVTAYIINNGRDKKVLALLSDCINIARDIIDAAPRGADPSDVIKQENRVKTLEKTEPAQLSTAGLGAVVKECLLDTVRFGNALKLDLKECGEERVRTIKEVYLKGVSVDVDSFRSGPLALLHEAEDMLTAMVETTVTILDDSSRKAYELAIGVTEAVCKWRNDAVYSYLDIGADMLRPLTEAKRLLAEWDGRAVGVDAKNNPRISGAEAEGIRGLWTDDQASRYAAEAEKRGLDLERATHD